MIYLNFESFIFYAAGQTHILWPKLWEKTWWSERGLVSPCASCGQALSGRLTTSLFRYTNYSYMQNLR